jgi:hypothetical protein
MRRVRLSYLLLGTAIAVGLCAVWLVFSRSSELPLPALARDLPQGSWEQADLAFQERVRHRFPVGASEEVVLQVLVDEGFTISLSGTRANFEQPGSPCRLVWRVSWEADGFGRISGITGQYFGICLRITGGVDSGTKSRDDGGGVARPVPRLQTMLS